MRLVKVSFLTPLPLTDAAIALLAALAAFAVRLDLRVAFGPYRFLALALAIPSCILTPAIFHAFRVYRVYWPYAGWPEVIRTIAAAIAVTLALAILLLPIAFYPAVLTLPRSILGLFLLFLLSGVAVSRVIEVRRLRSKPAAPSG